MVVASHNLSAGRPCERRDPSPLASKVKKGLCSSAETRVRAAAMSAIALTLGSLRSQGRLIENPICDSPALAGEGWGGGSHRNENIEWVENSSPTRRAPAERHSRSLASAFLSKNGRRRRPIDRKSVV